ncbi:MAG: DUF305 domain-containing protein [Candidatus Saccharibacteria bacterium]
MNKEQILFGIVGLIVGASVTFGVMQATAKSEPQSIDKSQMMYSEGSMDHMVAMLRDKEGDEFDKEFIRQMIPHHEGAIEMAELINDRAKHEEVKALGRDIIAAQTSEIDRMEAWYSDWGYGTYDSSMMMDHSMH